MRIRLRMGDGSGKDGGEMRSRVVWEVKSRRIWSDQMGWKVEEWEGLGGKVQVRTREQDEKSWKSKGPEESHCERRRGWLVGWNGRRSGALQGKAESDAWAR